MCYLSMDFTWVGDGVQQVPSSWCALLDVPVPHFSGTQTDLSREACRHFWCVLLSPKVMVVHWMNLTMNFHPDLFPLLLVKPNGNYSLPSHLPLCLTQGPFFPHHLPGPAQYTLIQWSFTEPYWSLGSALTLEIQRQESSLFLGDSQPRSISPGPSAWIAAGDSCSYGFPSLVG